MPSEQATLLNGAANSGVNLASDSVVNSTVNSGELLRRARKRQRLSQLDLALRVGASQRHLSFLETGRSSASRGMLIALADALGMSPGGCNQLLLASGFAPRYGQRPLDDREMAPVRHALDHLLKAHDPFPAWVLDPCWNMLQCNKGADLLMEHITGSTLSGRAGGVNLLEAVLHPGGLRPAIENFDEVAAHLFHQSHAEATHQPALGALLERIRPLWPETVFRHDAEPQAAGRPGRVTQPRSPVLATQLRTPMGRLSFFSTFTTFGTPLDITVASLRVEHQFPADAQTERVLLDMAGARPASITTEPPSGAAAD